MKRLAIIIIIILILCLMTAEAVCEVRRRGSHTREQILIEQLTVSYAVFGKRDRKILSKLRALDPALGEKWDRIMDIWEEPVAVNDHLSQGLAEDDTLCLAALGMQLNPDGSMKEELVERLHVLYEAAIQYPEAVIICTGGGTASENPKATESGKMKEWLTDRGLDPERITAEEKSHTTVQNAIFTFDILEERYPRVRQIALISSDYHIPSGRLFFDAEAILRDSCARVVSNAAWHVPGVRQTAIYQARCLRLLSGISDTSFGLFICNGFSYIWNFLLPWK